jgi:hypothetical protein
MTAGETLLGEKIDSLASGRELKGSQLSRRVLRPSSQEVRSVTHSQQPCWMGCGGTLTSTGPGSNLASDVEGQGAFAGRGLQDLYFANIEREHFSCVHTNFRSTRYFIRDKRQETTHNRG